MSGAYCVVCGWRAPELHPTLGACALCVERAASPRPLLPAWPGPDSIGSLDLRMARSALLGLLAAREAQSRAVGYTVPPGWTCPHGGRPV